MNVFLTTFNLAEKGGKLSDSDLTSWLSPAFSKGGDGPDLVVIGVQEVVPLPVSLTGLTHPLLNTLTTRFASTLTSLSLSSPSESSLPSIYIPLSLSHHCGISLWVFYREASLAGKVGKAVTSGLGLAWFGMGNKGATGVRVGIDRGEGNWESFTFIVAHLAAHDHNLQVRNRSYRRILRSLLFPPSSTLTLPHQIHQTTHCFILGDLNYRLEKLPSKGRTLNQGQLTKEEFEADGDSSLAKERKELIDLDTLQQEQSQGRTMLGMTEGRLSTFAPTYKRIPGKTDGYNSKRVPGYTDRILYSSLYHPPNFVPGKDDEKRTTVLEYNSLPNIVISDHKPVYATIHIPHGEAGAEITGSTQHNTPFLTLTKRYPIPTAQDQSIIIFWKIIGTTLDRICGFHWLLLKPKLFVQQASSSPSLVVVLALEVAMVFILVARLAGYRSLF